MAKETPTRRRRSTAAVAGYVDSDTDASSASGRPASAKKQKRVIESDSEFEGDAKEGSVAGENDNSSSSEEEEAGEEDDDVSSAESEVGVKKKVGKKAVRESKDTSVEGTPEASEEGEEEGESDGGESLVPEEKEEEEAPVVKVRSFKSSLLDASLTCPSTITEAS
jgi:hypothetical protein